MSLYGDPTLSPVPTRAENRRPDCWGKSYLEGDLECRQCLYNTSCKEKIISLNISKPVGYKPEPPPVTSTTHYQGWAAPQTNLTPQQQTQNQLQNPFYLQLPRSAVQQTQPGQYSKPPTEDTYGWMNDPMFQPVTSAPTPYRPQMQGESFSERIVKNMFLSALEAVAGQAFLAIRQLVLPPSR